MSKLFKSPEKMFQISMWLISILFASFLIGFGEKVIDDVPLASTPALIEDFANKEVLKVHKNNGKIEKEEIERLNDLRKASNVILQNKTREYESAFEVHQNWLATRQVTANSQNSSNQDPDLLRKTSELDKLNDGKRKIQVEIENLDALISKSQSSVDRENAALKHEYDRVEPEFQNALRNNEFKIFGIRLSITLPLIVISGWLIIKKRKSSHWPLARGFVIFSAVAFFFELVPYLPSYGGYVRSGVGMIVSIIAGHYGIKWMQVYLIRRQEEAKRTEADRRSKLDEIVAIQKINAQLCPGCERPIPLPMDGVKVNNCVYCGLKLFDICKNHIDDGATLCGVRKNAFYKHCPSCGNTNFNSNLS